jgi:hypothetical protein
MRHAPRAKDGRRKTNGTIAGLPSFIVHDEFYTRVRGKGIHPDKWIILPSHMWPLSPQRAGSLDEQAPQ